MREELTANGEIVLYPSRKKLLLVFLGGCGFVVLGIVMLRIRNMDLFRRIEFTAAGVAAILFFGCCAIYALYRLLWRRPSVIVGPSGITDQSSVLGIGHIPWSQVESLVSYRYKGQPMLGIVPRDIADMLRHRPWWQRRLLEMNLALGCAPLNVSQVAVPGTIDDLAKLIASRFGVSVRLEP